MDMSTFEAFRDPIYACDAGVPNDGQQSTLADDMIMLCDPYIDNGLAATLLRGYDNVPHYIHLQCIALVVQRTTSYMQLTCSIVPHRVSKQLIQPEQKTARTDCLSAEINVVRGSHGGSGAHAAIDSRDRDLPDQIGAAMVTPHDRTHLATTRL